jgi:MFS superfamily sulfate permease-like transporter
MPGRVLGLTPFDLRATELALLLGVLTIVVMIGWEKVRPASLSLVPGALLGVVAATVVAFAFGLDVTRVSVPESIGAAFKVPADGFFAPLLQPAVILSAVAIAFIASAETLLSAAAVDRMHDGVRTDYNKELRAQGVGNLLCGGLGGLPMTGVIVRSSANVQAGAKTRMSTVMHGTWILGFVALMPWLLREIPMAALGGVLVVTGWRLVSLTHVRHLLDVHGRLPALIWLATFVLVVTTDLLTGVLVGLALSLLELIPHARRLKLGVSQKHENEVTHLTLEGTATFLSLTRLNAILEEVPPSRQVRLDLSPLKGMDHTTAQTLGEWLARQRKGGARVEVTGPEEMRRTLHHAV